jgi:hypothetical protein
MKTKSQYLQDMEFSLSEISIGISDKDLKARFRLLSKKYHSDNGLEKNQDKHRIINDAFNAIKSEKFEKEKVKEPTITSESTAEHYTKAFFDFLDQGAIIIELKNSDNKVILIDNVLINFDCSNLTEDKVILINRCRIFKFLRKKP